MNPVQQERAYLYRLLARLFSLPVDQPLLDSIAAIELLEPENRGAYHSAWRTLAQIAATMAIEKLDDEFHQLFIGLGRGELSPFYSYYESGFLMEQPLVQLRTDLQKLGYQRQQSNREPEDHISAICEVMALLIIDNREEQGEFFQLYIKSWFGRFFDDLKQLQTGTFYPAIARLGKHFLQMEILSLD